MPLIANKLIAHELHAKHNEEDDDPSLASNSRKNLSFDLAAYAKQIGISNDNRKHSWWAH